MTDIAEMHEWVDGGLYYAPRCKLCGTTWSAALKYNKLNPEKAARERCPKRTTKAIPRRLTAADLQRVQKGEYFETVLCKPLDS